MVETEKMGIEKLQAAVKKDCDLFDNKEAECTCDRCTKYKWVIDRATQYAELLGSTTQDVIQEWEAGRSYWYMNYYQECNQPDLSDTSYTVVKHKDWMLTLAERFGGIDDWTFICPSCGGKQSVLDLRNAGVDKPEGKVYFNCIGRYVKDHGCDWTLGGLLSIHKSVVVTEQGRVVPVFEMAEA